MIAGILVWLSPAACFALSMPSPAPPKRWPAGILSQRVAIPPHTELGRLSERFNHMADRIEELVSRLSGEHERLQIAHACLAESERRQRELIADVSHELRTPLAVIRSSVDALVDGVADDGERQRRCLRAIEERDDRPFASGG